MTNGFSIGDIFAAVPKTGPAPGQEQITYIDEHLLQEDGNNFYHIDGIEELASNIQLVGLQQPIRVRPDPEDEGAYLIVSGHRRLTAIRTILKKEEPERWAKIPCIIEDHPEESDAMRELRLIFANLDTRKMTDADLDRQAERMTALFKQLKAEGYEFHGRIRDYVAEALDVSKSKLSRLKVIREGLISPLLSLWEKGGLTESCAVRIAQENPDTQAALFAKTRGIVQQLKIEQIDGIIYDLTHKEIDFSAVDEAIEKSKEQDLQPEFNVSEYLAQRAAEDMTFLVNLSKCADTFITGLYHSGRNKNERVDWLKNRFRNCGHGSSDYSWNGESKGLRLCGHCEPYVSRTWSEVYDMLCSIALRDYDKPPQPSGQMVFSGWMPGGTTPGHSCECVVDFSIEDGGKEFRQLARFDAVLSRWTFKHGAAIEATPVRWMELPDVPEEEENKINPLNDSCITGASPSGHCGAAQYCGNGYTCCAQCAKNCNMRCGWISSPDIAEVEEDA